MKAEINELNKDRFFAQYHAQLNISYGFYPSDDFINLKPLSSISDEDAEEIGKLYGGFYDTKEDLQNYKDHVILALIEDDEEAHNWWDHVGFKTMSRTCRDDIMKEWSGANRIFFNDYDIPGAIPVVKKPKRKLEL